MTEKTFSSAGKLLFLAGLAIYIYAWSLHVKGTYNGSLLVMVFATIVVILGMLTKAIPLALNLRVFLAVQLIAWYIVMSTWTGIFNPANNAFAALIIIPSIVYAIFFTVMKLLK